MVVAAGCESWFDVAVEVDALESVVPGLAETRLDVGTDADTAADALCIAADALAIANDALDSAAAALADRKSTRLNSSHSGESRMPSSA